MQAAEQIVFPFVSLDFPGRAVPLQLWEIASKLGVSVDHLLNEVEAGSLKGLDLKGAQATRRNVRVPVECYRAYVIERMTAEFRASFVRDLPRGVRVALVREICGSLLNDFEETKAHAALLVLSRLNAA